MEYLIGLDVGTSGAKAILIDAAGEVLAASVNEHPLQTPHPLWSEQNPEDWWRAACQSIHGVLVQSGLPSSQIVAVGLTGQMHGLVLLDADRRVLRPAILWNDQRTGRQCQQINDQIGFEKLLSLTGNPVLPGFTAPKIAWVREHEPEIYGQVRHFLLPKDYLRFRLTGELITDVSDASGTSLFDVKNRTWSTEMFSALNIPLSWAPTCLESIEISGRLHADAAAATGLAQNTPVVAGGGDQAAQAVGTGLYQEGLVSVTLGTSGVVFAPTDRPMIEPQGRLHAFCHAIPEKWHVMGVMLAAGGSLRWYRDTLCRAEKEEAAKKNIDPYELITADAAQAPVGSDGLFFLPYLSGERTPHPDPDARGAFIGLTVRHKKSHLSRAVLEGISFGLADSFTLTREQGISTDQVRVTGGGAKSPFWRQMLTDILKVKIETVTSTEGAAYGAALLAGVGAGVFPSVEDACRQTIRPQTTAAPDDANVAQYEKHYSVYRTLYRALKPSFDAIAALSEKSD